MREKDASIDDDGVVLAISRGVGERFRPPGIKAAGKSMDEAGVVLVISRGGAGEGMRNDAGISTEEDDGVVLLIFGLERAEGAADAGGGGMDVTVEAKDWRTVEDEWDEERILEEGSELAWEYAGDGARLREGGGRLLLPRVD